MRIFKDCAGVCFGKAKVDRCGVCYGGSTQVVKDSTVDICNVCGGMLIREGRSPQMAPLISRDFHP